MLDDLTLHTFPKNPVLFQTNLLLVVFVMSLETPAYPVLKKEVIISVMAECGIPLTVTELEEPCKYPGRVKEVFRQLVCVYMYAWFNFILVLNFFVPNTDCYVTC